MHAEIASHGCRLTRELSYTINVMRFLCLHITMVRNYHNCVTLPQSLLPHGSLQSIQQETDNQPYLCEEYLQTKNEKYVNILVRTHMHTLMNVCQCV